MARNDEYSKEFTQKFIELKKAKKIHNDKLNSDFNVWAHEWLKINCPYSIQQVLQIVGNNRIKLQRFVIYDFNIQMMDEFPIVSVWGWWLDKNNDPVKWGSYPIVNCTTNFKMELSENQKHNPVPTI